MADKCCKNETACCEPPALVLPEHLVRAVPAAACGTAGDTCCPTGVPVFDGVNPRYKRILWMVIGINGAMFGGEIVAGQLAGSQALKADALDFLADTVTYGLSLAVIGASLRTRATAALAKGVSLSLMALWVFSLTVYQTLILGLPKAEGFCCKFRGSPYSGYIDPGRDGAWQGNGSGRQLLQGASIHSGSDSVGRSLVSDVPGQLPRSRAHAHRPRCRGGPHDDLPLDPGLCRGA